MTDSTKKHRNDLDPLDDMEWFAEWLFIEGPFPFALIKPSLHYVRVSRSFSDILGREATYFPGKSVVTNGFTTAHKALMQKALDMDQIQVLKNWTVTAAGQETKTACYWQWSIIPLHDVEGRLYGLLLSGLDVTEQRLLESEVIEAASRERREVSREIHDNVGQLLAAMSMKAKVLELKLKNQQPVDVGETRELQDLAGELIVTHRRIAQMLYPVDVEAGEFLTALERLAEDTTKLYGASCQVTAPDQEPNWESVQAVHIYAIVKAIIEHAVGQADAQDLSIEFFVEPERYVVRVIHNGKAYARTGTIRGYRMMTFHAHTVGGRLVVEGHAGQPVTFTGIFPRMMGDDS